MVEGDSWRARRARERENVRTRRYRGAFFFEDTWAGDTVGEKTNDSSVA